MCWQAPRCSSSDRNRKRRELHSEAHAFLLFLFLFIFQHLLGEMSIEELDEGPRAMMITPITMPMMRRAEGACRVLFMTSFSFSFCFSPFCCFCVENSGLEPGFNGRFVQSFANDDEDILPLRDGFQRLPAAVAFSSSQPVVPCGSGAKPFTRSTWPQAASANRWSAAACSCCSVRCCSRKHRELKASCSSNAAFRSWPACSRRPQWRQGRHR